MLVIDNNQVFQIDGDEASRLMESPGLVDDITKIAKRSEELMMELDEQGVVFTNEYHFDIVFRKLRVEDEEMRQAFWTVYRKMFDLFKEEVMTKGGYMSTYLRNDIKPEEVPFKIHGENGLGYNMDTGYLIDCDDCIKKGEEALRLFKGVVALQDKADAGEVTPEDLEHLLDLMPDMAEGNPPMIVAIHTNEGTVLVGPKDTTPEFDEDLPMPTHVAKRTLN